MGPPKPMRTQPSTIPAIAIPPPPCALPPSILPLAMYRISAPGSIRPHPDAEDPSADPRSTAAARRAGPPPAASRRSAAARRFGRSEQSDSRPSLQRHGHRQRQRSGSARSPATRFPVPSRAATASRLSSIAFACSAAGSRASSSLVTSSFVQAGVAQDPVPHPDRRRRDVLLAAPAAAAAAARCARGASRDRGGSRPARTSRPEVVVRHRDRADAPRLPGRARPPTAVGPGPSSASGSAPPACAARAPPSPRSAASRRRPPRRRRAACRRRSAPPARRRP